MELLAALDGADTEAEAIDLLTALEDVKSACAAAQARVTTELESLRITREAETGVPVARRGRGLAAEVALARRSSGNAGGRHLGFARAMTEMPHTMAALTAGRLSEWRATIVVRETAYLTLSDRQQVDRRLCGDPSTLTGVGDRGLEAEAKRIAYELDPQAVVRRNASANKDRRVSIRPQPDAMVRLSALLPMVQGISAYAALNKHADAVRGADERSHAQIMADALVERVVGISDARATPVAVSIVLPETVLAGEGSTAAHVDGYGMTPAWTATSLIADALDADAQVELRRLYEAPSTGSLVAMESRGRLFPDGLRRFILARDRRCRIPYCDAPIAEFDHAEPHCRGGPTTAANGLGACVHHNRVKETPGWDVRIVETGGRHTAEVTTPTDHRHRSVAPAPVGHHDTHRGRVSDAA